MKNFALLILSVGSIVAGAQDATVPAVAPDPVVVPEVVGKIQSTRESILNDEKTQREALGHLFSINQQVKEIAKKQEQLNQKMLSQEAGVRTLAQEVAGMEMKAEAQKERLNQRLRQLYQTKGRSNFHWLFMSGSPIELERNHRFLRLMLDSDHRKFKAYVASVRELKRKRNQLKDMVGHLAGMQKEIQNQEGALTAQMRAKSKLLADLKQAKDMKLNKIKDLRTSDEQATAALSYAFFERKGALRAPVDLPLVREFGTYVDPVFRFRLTHKGLFFATREPAEVRAVYNGRVALAEQVPGFGRMVIVDHGDNYYSVYAFNKSLKVREGMDVREGEAIAVSGGSSPLFGPGLYFEIRHFTDAIDPRPWIKDSILKTANLSRE